jgi:hypothetical protein
MIQILNVRITPEVGQVAGFKKHIPGSRPRNIYFPDINYRRFQPTV